MYIYTDIYLYLQIRNVKFLFLSKSNFLNESLLLNRELKIVFKNFSIEYINFNKFFLQFSLQRI